MASGKTRTAQKTKTKQKPAAKKKVARPRATARGAAKPKAAAKATAKRPRAAKAAAKAAAKNAGARRAPRKPASASGVLGVPASYLKALADYEKAIAAFHQRDFKRAEALFLALCKAYPQERDLADRARVYASLCRKQREAEPRPRNAEDFYYRGIFHGNRGEYEEAVRMLRQAVKLGLEGGRARYGLAAVLARTGETEEALQLLRAAIQADPENRQLARSDPDFAGLADAQAFLALVGDPEGEPAR